MFDARSSADTKEEVSASTIEVTFSSSSSPSPLPSPSPPPLPLSLPPLPNHLQILAPVPKDDTELEGQLEAWRNSGDAARKWLVYSLTPATAIIILPPPLSLSQRPPPPAPSTSPLPTPSGRSEGGSGGSMVRRGEILACLEWLEAVGVVSVVAVIDRTFGDLVKSLMFLGFSTLSATTNCCLKTIAHLTTDFVLLKADLVDR
ncbi:unnamed protein product [Hydatigera taeniaeformis]|uniref:Uncharacterized protein n=1 Tax=Hydatigena taeniaeformis TaxID=6205 RepID=A0A0R3WL38_HYDTA|nr:unnamed protein product [Hydatigera taeniaeformis]